MKNTLNLKAEHRSPSRTGPVIMGCIIGWTPALPLTPTTSAGRAQSSISIPGERVEGKGVSSCKGFTLLEIMVAVAIMAIVLVSIYKLHAQTISMNGSVRFYTTAPLLAQRTIAEIQAFPDRRPAIADGNFGDEFPGYSRQVLIDDVSADIFGGAANDLKKIEVTISFNQNEFIYTVRTYSILQEP